MEASVPCCKQMETEDERLKAPHIISRIYFDTHSKLVCSMWAHLSINLLGATEHRRNACKTSYVYTYLYMYINSFRAFAFMQYGSRRIFGSNDCFFSHLYCVHSHLQTTTSTVFIFSLFILFFFISSFSIDYCAVFGRKNSTFFAFGLVVNLSRYVEHTLFDSVQNSWKSNHPGIDTSHIIIQMLLSTDQFIRCEYSDLCRNANIRSRIHIHICTRNHVHYRISGKSTKRSTCCPQKTYTLPKIYIDMWWILIVVFSSNLRLCSNAFGRLCVCEPVSHTHARILSHIFVRAKWITMDASIAQYGHITSYHIKSHYVLSWDTFSQSNAMKQMR